MVAHCAEGDSDGGDLCSRATATCRRHTCVVADVRSGCLGPFRLRDALETEGPRCCTGCRTRGGG